MDERTLCQSCGTEAIARVHSEWLCARCGLHRTTVAAGIGAAGDQPSPGRTRSWRTAIKTAIGSGLAAKMLIGAAALAAVGGAVASEGPPASVPPAPPASTPVGPPTSPVPGELPAVANPRAVEATTPGVIPADRSAAGTDVGVENMPDNVSEYVAAVHAWSSCVDAAVHDFASTRPVAGQGFDPLGECPGRPNPSEFNLGNAYGRPEQTGKPDDPGSQRYEAPGRPDDPGK